MLSTAIIIFREVLEIALVLTVLLAATRALRGGARLTWIGVVLGTVASVIVAYFAKAISSAAEGMGQELFNAIILSLAAVLIIWHVVWMSKHGREMARHFQEVGQSVSHGEKPLYMLSVVMAVAVLREGSEIVLFMYGLFVQGVSATEAIVGGLLGLAGAVLTGTALYYGMLKISPKRLFSITSWLLVLLAAGMVSQAVGFLSAAGWVPELVSPLWDMSAILSEHGLAGRILHTLLGYSERPSGAQVLAYLMTIGVVIVLLRWFGNSSSGAGGKRK